MPQFTEFPYLPSGEFRVVVDGLIEFCRTFPPDGEPFPSFRKRLKRAKLWSRERLQALYRFFRITESDPITPSPLMQAVAETSDGDSARELLTERLWAVNPILFKVIVERLEERVHSANELHKFVDSFAYPGATLTGPELRSWIQLAQGLEVFKPVGIRLGLTERGKRYLRQAKDLDIDEYLDEDVDESPPVAKPPSPPSVPAASTQSAGGVEPPSNADGGNPTVAPTPDTADEHAGTPLRPPDSAEADDRLQWLLSPRDRYPRVPAARFADHSVFDADVLEETTTRIHQWWASQLAQTEAPEGSFLDRSIEPVDVAAGLTAESFGVDAERWERSAEESLYRLAVGAALIFRLGQNRASVVHTFDDVDRFGVLDALYSGTPPECRVTRLDPQALMLASLVARRCAEAGDLARELERQTDGAGVLGRLDAVLGRGLFKLELFWLVRVLKETGALQVSGLEHLCAMPDRRVRDILFRLGYVASPYAPNIERLTAAAGAVRRAAGGGSRPDRTLILFARAADCAFGCAHARDCEFACHERADLH